MTNKEAFKANAERNGLTVTETKNSLSWVTLNGAERFTTFFDDEGRFTGKRITEKL